MPHLRFRGIERDPVARLSGSLIQKLSAFTGAPAAHFTIERVPTEFIIAGRRWRAIPSWS